MLADDRPVSVNDAAGSERLRDTLPQEPPIIIVRDEADLLAFRLLGSREAQRCRLRSHLILRQLANGKARRRKLGLGQRPEKVGLILLVVVTSPQQPSPGGLLSRNSGVVACGDCRSVPRPSAAQQRPELDVAITC